MKTANLFATTFMLVALLGTGKVKAQNETAEITLCNSESCTAYTYPVSNNMIVNSAAYADLSATVLSVDEQNETIKLNYVIPSHTYSATLMVQDFNGRNLRTITINPNATNATEFYIKDLLSGTYDYTLVLNNQRNIYGKFIVKDQP